MGYICPLLWTKVEGWFFLLKPRFFYATGWHPKPFPSLKNLGWNEKLSRDWGHNRSKIYTINWTKGLSIGWKQILQPEKRSRKKAWEFDHNFDIYSPLGGKRKGE